MAKIRIIPTLLLHNSGLYKTVNFKNPVYVGDPINAVKIFNEKEADELLLLDYLASAEGREPDYNKISEIAGEAFMPMAYGGGIKSWDIAKKVFDCGYEKVVLNSALFDDISLIDKIAAVYGSQAVVGSVDIKKDLLGRNKVYAQSGKKKTGYTPAEWAIRLEQAGAGEIMINSIERDGTWSGYALDVISEVSHKVSVPVIACGGAGSFDDLEKAAKAGASAVAAGSMFVFQKKGMGVLISFPTGKKIIV
ncbi:MAG: imidazole glycerol phosphate synthase subunit HisF [Bacteroidetes bacterium]|nr:imidazole glycerol phosphate synthase subunit HisF [Bacteroidota bacterium]